MTKIMKRNILFFLILILLFGILSIKTERELLKRDHLVPVRNKNMYRIRREQKDSIDVIILGDSLSYSAISPMRLWEGYGFTSYVCGQSGQKMSETEEMLKIALKAQTPRVVVLETDVLYNSQSTMKSVNEVLESALNYRVPVFRGHDIWKSLVMKKEYIEENYKGFAFRCSVNPYENGDYMKDTGEKKELPEIALLHMDRIISMCREVGAELVLVGTPSPTNYSYAKHRALSEYAREKSLVLLDMNLLIKEIGIDWKSDSLDNGDHLNLSGAEKVSSFLGQYLSEKYALPDHRGNPEYKSWENESKIYEEKASQWLKEIRGKSA